MESSKKTQTLLVIAIIMAGVAIVIAGIGIVKAKDAKDVAQSTTGQQTALSADLNQRVNELERQAAEKVKQAESEIGKEGRAATREAARAEKINRKNTESVAAVAKAAEAKQQQQIAATNKRIDEANATTAAELQRIEAQIKKLQKQINNLP